MNFKIFLCGATVSAICYFQNSMSLAMEALWRETLVRRDRRGNQGRVRFRLPHVGQHGQPSEAFESSRVDLKRDRWIQSPEC